jgi:hypothetical protein
MGVPSGLATALAYGRLLGDEQQDAHDEGEQAQEEMVEDEPLWVYDGSWRQVPPLSPSGRRCQSKYRHATDLEQCNLFMDFYVQISESVRSSSPGLCQKSNPPRTRYTVLRGLGRILTIGVGGINRGWAQRQLSSCTVEAPRWNLRNTTAILQMNWLRHRRKPKRGLPNRLRKTGPLRVGDRLREEKDRLKEWRENKKGLREGKGKEVFFHPPSGTGQKKVRTKSRKEGISSQRDNEQIAT